MINHAEVASALRWVIGRFGPDTAADWTGFATVDDLEAEIQSLIDAAEADGLTEMDAERLRLLFLPTGPVQALSISNGWGREFVALASRIDAALDSG